MARERGGLFWGGRGEAGKASMALDVCFLELNWTCASFELGWKNIAITISLEVVDYIGLVDSK